MFIFSVQLLKCVHYIDSLHSFNSVSFICIAFLCTKLYSFYSFGFWLSWYVHVNGPSYYAPSSWSSSLLKRSKTGTRLKHIHRSGVRAFDCVWVCVCVYCIQETKSHRIQSILYLPAHLYTYVHTYTHCMRA